MAISSQITKKKTLAQLRAEKEQRQQDEREGLDLAVDVQAAVQHLPAGASSNGPIGQQLETLLRQAIHACRLLKGDGTDVNARYYGDMLRVKADIHTKLGHHLSAMAALQEADQVFIAAEARGVVTAVDHITWSLILDKLANLHLCSHRVEAAKRCYQNLLAWPRLTVSDRMTAMHGMARCHKARKEWGKVFECCEAIVPLLPAVSKGPTNMGWMKMKVLLLLADAAEGCGDLTRARQYDLAAKAVCQQTGNTSPSAERVPCDRREALELIAAGKAQDAAKVLTYVPGVYVEFLHRTGLNPSEYYMLELLMPAVLVFADAMVATEIPSNVVQARLIRADVEETKAILAGFWEGVLEEARWELAERRRKAATAAAAEAATAAEATKKSKAAKRKQQKRKAQQQRKAEAVAATVVVVEEDACAPDGDERMREDQGGREEHTQQQQQDEQQEEDEQEEEEEEAERNEEPEEQEEDGNQECVAAVVAGLAVMAVGETKGQDIEDEGGEEKGGGEDEERECSVCLTCIDSDDADNPAGPPLSCGHRYHAFCLHFWVEKCTSKCIEPTCPYCRAPLQELEGI